MDVAYKILSNPFMRVNRGLTEYYDHHGFNEGMWSHPYSNSAKDRRIFDIPGLWGSIFVSHEKIFVSEVFVGYNKKRVDSCVW